MIGQTLAGRYEILDRIGGGGMALVYRARDILLNRTVAVKILRQQFVHDEEFIQRFRREGQSAAALSHPNIVSIYDVGQRDDIHYIVMEYVEGTNLYDLIREKAPLQVEESVRIASQIADALDHAHSNQIIHRDIKPHNILIGRNGRVKVTDFGIARAAASSSITQTGSVVGSVHYFSPEHAKGVSAGAKSDLYSLGIVLYQMLTGRLPFSGESPVSVALKHLQEDVPEPRKVNPLIPQSVENIILKAMRKNPDARYQSAREMQRDLETCLNPERRNEPKLAVADLGGDDDARTLVMPAIRTESYTPKAGAEPGSSPAPRKRKWVKPAVWTAVLLLLIAGLLFAASAVKKLAAPKDIQVPNVVGMQLDQAKAELEKAELQAETSERESEKPKGEVIDQDPPSGTIKERPGLRIKLVVSSGIQMATMEDYTGKPLTEARDALTRAGVDSEKQITMEEVDSDEEAGIIVEQDPKQGDSFDPAKVQITFKVSAGREKMAMPDLTGKQLAVAKAMLEARGLPLLDGNIIRRPNFSQPEGTVYDQFPYKPGEEVESGVKDIILYVSSGMPKDAGTAVFSLPPVPPAREGAKSIVRIEASDAKSENREIVTKEIAEPQIFNVPVVVTRDTAAKVNVYRDNVLYETYTFTYQDYLDSQNKPTPAPTQNPDGNASPGATPAGGSSAPASPPASHTATPTPKGGDKKP